MWDIKKIIDKFWNYEYQRKKEKNFTTENTGSTEKKENNLATD